ncbi:hypothetical protein H113_01991 [Trichophyton rubrum MR1459]|uniref:Uncharacterized protein n=1 Tax=Trichophyton rubrum CBS 288.86 TaxID=1215330 RepID=A0A022WAV3_TRIRU|nr:hypothetical protein H100_01984 [Trichophyton rubrum MR850]EZF44784.1 hypothetical protein H102_01983 [Trichophyton rubrum CBS 100081]EZF55459.1 hypothetical protein H103_01994 [Trichophyton rubrum CBS 288.86]EZF66200.1 hypothetical protein H104_01969 [Trichophyton rubrum CBS 289.86]EZF87368.1 hypothetical protein H110_01993 [Trichophyton rubrum MR1448]EZF98147.1 hypothetical protein H113_01991 [Trichophyton rubrum MR1459]EZG19680.1 hypothetical protein H107_02053 [Trichophyton rubrum CBS 
MDPSLSDENPDYKQPGDHNLTSGDVENETLGDDYCSDFVNSHYWPVLDFPPLTNGSTRGTNDDSFPQEHQADDIYEHPLHIEAGDTGLPSDGINLRGVSTWNTWRDLTTVSVRAVGSSGDLIEECNQLSETAPSPPWNQLGITSATNMALPQPVQLLPSLPRHNPTLYAGNNRQAAESSNNRAPHPYGVNERREETLPFQGVLAANIGPSMVLPTVRLKPKAEAIHSLSKPFESEETTIYVRDEIKKITVVWNEWLDEVADDQHIKSCKLVFGGSHGWALQALDMVCSFASTALHIPSIGDEDKVNNPNMMLHCSVRLFFAIYLMSTPLEVSGMGIESEKERIEVEYQFKSKARSVLENLISKISKNLDNLICKKRRQYIGHILATLVFLSLSCHFNQLIRLRLAGIGGNESSTKVDIDAMNRNIHYINKLVYSTFRPQIERILKPRKQDPHTPGDNNQDQLSTSTEELRQVNSKLIWGLWSTVTDINKKET